ncbi:MAG: homocysteine S-methyltransferase family protein [Eubacterium sp.]|nr:homocysteine S-methyltransferase family protein [Eubacterium sp.]
MNILEFAQDNLLYLDGGMGTLLQEAGLMPGELPERWNIERPDEIVKIHKAYYEAGSNVVLTNTFGANPLKFSDEELTAIVEAAVANAKKARELADAEEGKSDNDRSGDGSGMDGGRTPRFIALDIGPCGRLLKPYGDLDFEDAVEVYAKIVRAGAHLGVDLIFIETMNDSYDTKAALLAAKENSDLPVFVSNAYGSDGKLMTGASPAAMVAMLEGMHADAIGANCSLGPDQLKGVIDEYLAYASVPVLLKPNAGLPKSVDGKTVYDVYPDEFAESIRHLVEKGVRITGGCCGTTPDYIKAVREATKDVSPVPVTDKNRSLISSYTKVVEFGRSPILIGERINPTGKKRFKQALRENDIDYILGEGLHQQDAGAHVLDVNVGLPEIDEPAMLLDVVQELQAVSDLPLQLDTTDPVAMEAGLRAYNGKAMVNSVNGKEEVMDQVFPLVAKYGGFVVCLTLDEGGIPDDAERRVEIAEKIIKRAADYGIAKKDLIFDPLAMAISADTKAALATITAVDEIRHRLGVNTSLGVSNVSFGLPERPVVTAAFFASTLERGLSAAIMNPYSVEMMDVYHAFRALHDMDENCMDYIEYVQDEKRRPKQVAAGTAGVGGGSAGGGNGSSAASGQSGSDAGAGSESTSAIGQTGSDGTMGSTSDVSGSAGADSKPLSELQNAIKRGLKDKAGSLTRSLLEHTAPLDIVQGDVIPALDVVGQDFEAKRVFLPQLLMAAEAAKAAFEEIKSAMAKADEEKSGDDQPGSGAENSSSKTNSNLTIVIATVHGDIHDIGKNIVKLLLENYGFNVIDLGKDVPEQDVVDKAVEVHADMVGLSALMTTTVPAMESTIKLLREQAPWVKACVGGAVLTQEYADSIGADRYCKDAMDTVRYAESLIKA